jgi:predicted DNA-binding transcriptional regulator YafY
LRNAEVIRQWTILGEIERARTGVTIDQLAARTGVSTRTIRRDIEALEAAGFPVYDDRSADDGRTRWRVNGQAFRGLAAGLTLSELCALYFSRTLLEALAGTPFRDDLGHAFDKLVRTLTPHMRRFLDQLPHVIVAKADPSRRLEDPRRAALVARALEGTLEQREASMRYHSQTSRRTKTYLVHPYRLAYAQGALYLLAFVPEYGEVRTFAVDRIEQLTLRDERFTPVEALPDEAFPHSLGVHSGPPEHVEIEFDPGAADYVRARIWHPSQCLRESPGGGVVASLDVCRDRALTSWILSFGPFARVLAPASLASEVAAQIESARARYDSA